MKKSLLLKIRLLFLAVVAAGMMWSCIDDKPEIEIPVVPKETIVLDTEYVLDNGGGDEEESNNNNYTEPTPAPTTTPAASVPLPTGDVPAQVPQVSAPPLPGSGEEVTVEVIRGTQTQSTTVRSE